MRNTEIFYCELLKVIVAAGVTADIYPNTLQHYVWLCFIAYSNHLRWRPSVTQQNTENSHSLCTSTTFPALITHANIKEIIK